MRPPTYFLFILTVSCARPRPTPQPAPLNADEARLTGCYNLVVESWGAVSDSSSKFELQLDSSGSVVARYLKVLSSPIPAYRFTYWTSTAPNAFSAHLVWGVEGQGFEFQMRLTGDSVVGAAAEHQWPGHMRLAPARGARQQCSVG